MYTPANIPAIVIVELDDGYVVNASNGCVALTSDPARARTFTSESAALNFLLEHAPGVVAWSCCVKFCRCTSNSFLRAMCPQPPNTRTVS
jgi:hypothetical protein